MTIFYCNGGEAEIIFRVLMGWDFFLCVHQLGGKVGVRVDELFVPLAESGKENHNFRLICLSPDHLSAQPDDALKLGSSFLIKERP